MKKIHFLSIALLAMIIAGCSIRSDEQKQPSNSLKDTPINVKVLMTEIQTRAGYDNDNQPTMFYLSIDQVGESYDYHNVVMKYEEDKWVAYESADVNAAKKQLLWEGSEGTVTVTAATFSLSTSSNTSYSLSVAADQSYDENLKACDHLYYYSNNIKPSVAGISIQFDHIMSKVEIKLTLRDEFEGLDDPITSVVLTGASLSASYTPAAETKWSSLSTADDVVIKACPLAAYDKEARTATYEVILIPQSVAEKSLCVTIFIGDNSYEWNSADAVTLTSGTKEILSLTVGRDKVSGNSFTASAWESAGEEINRKTE